MTLYSFGQYKDALGLFDGLIDVNPLDDASYYYGGLCHYSMRNLQKALTYFEKAHSLDPNNYYYSQILASVYSVGLNTKDKAIVLLEDLAVNYPKRTDSYFLLYTLYAEKGEIDKALAAVKHIEEAYGENPNTIRIRFNLLKSVGREEEGYALLREYYAGAEEGQIEPDEWIFFSEVYMSAGKDSLALVCLENAKKTDNPDKTIDFRIAQGYYDQGKYDAYFQTLRKCFADKETPPQLNAEFYKRTLAVVRPEFIADHINDFNDLTQTLTSANPADSTVLVTAAGYYYSTNQIDNAVASVRMNMLLHPDNPGCALDYLTFLYQLRRWEDDFEQVAKESVAKFKYVEYLELLGAYYYLNDMTDKAISLYKYMSKGKNPEIVIQAYNNLGQLYFQKYKETGSVSYFNKSCKCYEQVLKKDPENTLALNNYAYYLSQKKKNLPKALEMSLKTLTVEPENPTYLDTAGYILYVMGKAEDAKAYFKKAMACGGKDHKEILIHYADCLSALGDKTLADYYYKLAQQLPNEE
ncbi:MAG: tetratricopeptide repeat protein [Bacteroidales bacterium]|nr:tetratricopeptide repeat protein [Bacteroidales bacterium]